MCSCWHCPLHFYNLPIFYYTNIAPLLLVIYRSFWRRPQWVSWSACKVPWSFLDCRTRICKGGEFLPPLILPASSLRAPSACGDRSPATAHPRGRETCAVPTAAHWRSWWMLWCCHTDRRYPPSLWCYWQSWAAIGRRATSTSSCWAEGNRSKATVAIRIFCLLRWTQATPYLKQYRGPISI